jgi:hypothetical protein
LAHPLAMDRTLSANHLLFIEGARSFWPIEQPHF